MADFDALVAELNQLTEELTRSAGRVPTTDLIARAQSLAAQVKAKAEEAKANLKDEALAFAAGLKARAAELRKPKPKPAEAPPPHPWEDHQGLDPAQLNHMVESLRQLAMAPPTRH
jgi:hypothetical protein